MEKQKFSKKLYVSGNEYDFALLMSSRNMDKQIPGFRKGAFNRSILDTYIGPQARQYIKYLKLKELFEKYTDVENAKVKMHLNNDIDRRDALFIISLEFEGIPKPGAETSSENVSKNAIEHEIFEEDLKDDGNSDNTVEL